METNRKFDDLRQKARQLSKEKDIANDPIAKDTSKLVEDLNTAYIELEMQNRELRDTNLKLEKAYKRYEEMYLNAPVAYITVNRTGNILQINKEAAELFGMPMHQFKYTSFLPFLEEKSKYKFSQILKKLFEYGEDRANEEIVFTDTRDRKTTCKLQALAYSDTASEERICRIALSDITREKQEIDQSEKQFKGIFNALNDAVFIHDFDANILTANETACRILGYSKDEMAQLKVKDIDSEENSEKVKKHIADLKSKGKIIFETLLKTKNNTHFPAEVHAGIINYRGNDAVVSVSRDITERKKAEIIQKELNNELKTANEELHTSVEQVQDTNEMLEQERDQFIGLLNSIPEDIYVADKKNYEVIFANEHIKQTTGHDFTGEKCYKALRGKNKPCDYCTNSIIFSDKKPYYWEKYNNNLKKHYYHIDQAINWFDGREAKFQLAVDISKQKEYESKLKELNATKDKFFSIISHDLKSPFNAILGFSSLLMKSPQKYDVSKAKQFIETINSSAKSAFKLLENLLEWSRMQTGKIQFQPENTAVKPIITEVASLAEPAAEEKNITISVNTEDNIKVIADRNMLTTILRNFVFNSVKFTRQGGEIHICAEKKQDKIRFSVADTGVGMSQDKIDKLFDISEKTSTPGTQNEKGTGLGLILSKEFINKHNSKIHAESTPGKGSTFSFELPAAKSDNSHS